MAALSRALGSESVPVVSSVCLLGFFVSASRQLFCGGGWRRSVEVISHTHSHSLPCVQTVCVPPCPHSTSAGSTSAGGWLPFVPAGSFVVAVVAGVFLRVSQVRLALLVAHTPRPRFPFSPPLRLHLAISLLFLTSPFVCCLRVSYPPTHPHIRC